MQKFFIMKWLFSLLELTLFSSSPVFTLNWWGRYWSWVQKELSAWLFTHGKIECLKSLKSLNQNRNRWCLRAESQPVICLRFKLVLTCVRKQAFSPAFLLRGWCSLLELRERTPTASATERAGASAQKVHVFRVQFSVECVCLCFPTWLWRRKAN